MRNKVNDLKKYAKERFFDNTENTLIESSDLNPKVFGNFLRHFIKASKNSGVIPPIKSIKENGEVTIAFSDVEKANLLNEYFASISR